MTCRQQAEHGLGTPNPLDLGRVYPAPHAHARGLDGSGGLEDTGSQREGAHEAVWLSPVRSADLP